MISIPHSFAIRHIPTGNLIPRAKGFRERGGSHVEPCDPCVDRPRFFKTHRSAKSWLTVWLRGKQIRDDYQNYEGEWEISIKTIPVPSRNDEEMEIVAVCHQIIGVV